MHDIVGRAWIGGRLENHQLPAPQMDGNRVHRLHDVRKVGVFGLAQGRRDADINRVHVGKAAEVRRGHQLLRLDAFSEVGLRHVGDVAAARVDLANLQRVDVEPNDS